MRCKCADYEVAGLYLERGGGVLEEACRLWEEDERWERENPVNGKGKGKGKGRAGLAKTVGLRRFVGEAGEADALAR